MSPPYEILLAALRCEIAALDGDDPDTIAAATAAKLDVLRSLRDAPPPPPAIVDAARALNALAAARTNVLMAGVGRRLRALAEATGRPRALTYGRDGRTTL